MRHLLLAAAVAPWALRNALPAAAQAASAAPSERSKELDRPLPGPGEPVP
jgi:hypothetical protein